MAVVNTNVNASIAQNALVRNERSMNTAMERLSTDSGSMPPKMMRLAWPLHLDDIANSRSGDVGFAMQ